MGNSKVLYIDNLILIVSRDCCVLRLENQNSTLKNVKKKCISADYNWWISFYILIYLSYIKFGGGIDELRK